MSVITEWTRILEQTTDMSAGCTMPTIAAGSNRLVLIAIRARSGGGTVSVPASITCNGVTANREAGDSVTRNRVALGVYVFREADIAAISGQTLSSIAEGTSSPNKAIFYKLLGDRDQGALAAVGNDFNDDGGSSTGNLSISLARLEGSWTEALSSSEGGFALTLTNPSKDGEMYGTGTSNIINYGSVESETAGTSAFTSTRVYRATALAINIAAASSAPEINPTGTTTSAAPGGAFTVNLSNMDGRTVASLELYDPVSGVSTAQSYTGTTSLTGTVTLGNLPYRDGMEWVVTLDNAAELTSEFEMLAASGRSLTEIEADFDETDQSIGYGFDPALEVGSQLEYATDTLTVYPDALFYTDYEGSQVVNHWSPTEGEWYQETIITGDEVLPDDYPDGVTFNTVTNAVLEQSYESNIVTISGVNIAIDLTIENGEYKINDGEWASTETTIENDDTLQLRATAPDANSETLTVTVNAGSRIFTWRIRTPYDDLPSASGKLSGRTIIGRKL